MKKLSDEEIKDLLGVELNTVAVLSSNQIVSIVDKYNIPLEIELFAFDPVAVIAEKDSNYYLFPIPDLDIKDFTTVYFMYNKRYAHIATSRPSAGTQLHKLDVYTISAKFLYLIDKVEVASVLLNEI